MKESAPIAGIPIRDVGFRSRFGAAVVAIMREPSATSKVDGLTKMMIKPKRQRVAGRLGDVALQPEDELLLDIGKTSMFLPGG